MTKKEEITPEVQAAIDEIVANFPGHEISHWPDSQGGAFVIVEEVALGYPYTQATSWSGFHITFSCPHADVYPHFFRADLSRTDNQPLGEGFGTNHVFPPNDAKNVPAEKRRQAVQVSRRSNKRDNNSNLETPFVKLMKVLNWMMRR